MADALVTIATREWRRRDALLRAMVARKQWPLERAQAAWWRWLSIALRTDVEISALPSDVAVQLNTMFALVGRLTDADRRSMLADDYADRHEWEPELGTATNRAVERQTQEPGETTLQQARDLIALSRALDVAVPWRAAEPAAQPERKAA
ncbi:hypothetical protein [Novosphingobium guangzhouense]|uniref:Uncharacterized protein n=1 Tax=Novosphingobium guangzhouense TaxID=1850347 RepID=A0A2K2FUN3_9SPHN|nr:hypothetical protein [Novosphingobium guangzhouense]PNU02497.1 hypothetical protein A8V01_08935 [Novosphingobium guangzhouense]